MQVLFVEDHTDTRTVLSTLLNRCGCRVVTAKNAQEAQLRLEEMSFDVLISDLALPDGDGINLVRFAKQARPQIRAIALTGRTSDEERSAGLSAGFDYYLTKPIDFHQLKQALGVESRPRLNRQRAKAGPGRESAGP